VASAPLSSATTADDGLGGLRLAFPRIYDHLLSTTHRLYSRPPRNVNGVRLKAPFFSSIYPTCTANFGPRTCTANHVDSSNSPGVPCAITALGNYDPDMGGHLVLEDLKLIVRFPPGATILIPSASFKHGNIPIQHNETRTSFTQYCPGGILRFVDWGFEGWAAKSKQQQDNIRASAADRFRDVLSRYSNISDLNEA
jgi:hypothetical protein